MVPSKTDTATHHRFGPFKTRASTSCRRAGTFALTDSAVCPFQSAEWQNHWRNHLLPAALGNLAQHIRHIVQDIRLPMKRSQRHGDLPWTWEKLWPLFLETTEWDVQVGHPCDHLIHHFQAGVPKIACSTTGIRVRWAPSSGCTATNNAPVQSLDFSMGHRTDKRTVRERRLLSPEWCLNLLEYWLLQNQRAVVL